MPYAADRPTQDLRRIEARSEVEAEPETDVAFIIGGHGRPVATGSRSFAVRLTGDVRGALQIGGVAQAASQVAPPTPTYHASPGT